MTAPGESLRLLAWALIGACGVGEPSPKRVGALSPSEANDWSCPHHAVDDTLAVRYHRIGDYCEGMYLEAVSSSTLVTVSLTESVSSIDFAAAAPIRIEWTNALPGVFHLQGTRIEGAPYDLDVRPNPQPWFEWPTSDVRKLGPRADQLGFLVWSKRELNGRERRLYFPATVTQGAGHSERHPQLVAMPGTQLTQVSVSLGPSDQSGKMTDRLIDARSVGAALYPANAPIVIPLEELATAPSGLYLIEVTARASSGMLITTLYHWLYHEL